MAAEDHADDYGIFVPDADIDDYVAKKEQAKLSLQKGREAARTFLL